MKRLALTSGMGVSVEGQQQDGSGTLHSELFGERTGAVRRLVRVITGWLETVEHRFDAFAGVRYAVLIQGGEQALTRHLVGCQFDRSEEHTSELQSRPHLVCRLLLEKKTPSWHGTRPFGD